MNLHYLIGDATDPIIKPATICHVCNDCRPGKWGAGFVMALSKKNKEPQEAYMRWSNQSDYDLGAVQLIPFAKDVLVANMIAQHDVRWKGKEPPIRYDAVEQCLRSVYKHCLSNSRSLHMPRIGCVLAGGNWLTIENIIKKTMTVDTYVYTLESQKDRWPTKYVGIDDLKADAGKEFCKACGATLDPEHTSGVCSTCIGEAQRRGDLPGNGVGGDVSDEDLAKYFK